MICRFTKRSAAVRNAVRTILVPVCLFKRVHLGPECSPLFSFRLRYFSQLLFIADAREVAVVRQDVEGLTGKGEFWPFGRAGSVCRCDARGGRREDLGTDVFFGAEPVEGLSSPL